ncbi:MAG: antirepressor protein KilAC domain [Bacteriophage sp.]|nr:MAG: antirepressor protein KilAC domain [Bacteriophage sp.]UWG92248.1 MAG: antirepressor protein KilAC domain [Bacteriophage sp.]
MQELIKIREENGQRLVSARELHEGLGIGQDFTSWIKRMIGFGFEENIDFTLTKFSEGKTTKHEYAITLDMAKHIAMVQRSEKGMQFRNYFIQCEKQLQEISVKDSYLIDDPIERAKAWIKEQEEKQQLLLEKQNLEYTNNILTHTNKTYTTTEIAKELNLNSARELNRRLCKDKIQFMQNGTYVLYSDYANKGYTSIKQTVLDDDRIIYNTRWTDLGREFILKKYSQVGFEV